MDIIEPLKNNKIPVIFDGITAIKAFGTAFHLVVGFESVEMFVNIWFWLNSMTACNTTHEMVAVLL